MPEHVTFRMSPCASESGKVAELKLVGLAASAWFATNASAIEIQRADTRFQDGRYELDFEATLDAPTAEVQRVLRNYVQYPKLDAVLDITAAHRTCPLRLEELAYADTTNFTHDVFGINKHLNRETGLLEDCFRPSYSR